MPKYLRPDDLAERWGVSTGTLSNWRSRGIGPTFVKIGANVRYALTDVESYEAAGRTEAVA
jgi:predicted site-specific integrase-resolvase